ncbi:CidA/LrgA family protein [Rhodobacter ferrooxidans]|uniref:LrgA family protein n=1 Tax=Rhodobacter ferrooxidans TaxID=371731 RepID=C8RYR5_9RHOB|nr:CidA/LrgA family protein [Rhodobacter sp. SW2]EEW26253.1 LrgA family protein [Rhodobacter sp. SW2]
MIAALLAVLLCQLAGETASRALALPLPGPVLGMLLMLAAFAALPRLAQVVRPLAQGILGNLALLFVPAGVGVIGHLDRLGAEGLPLLVALIGSTVLAIAVGALTFAAVARLTGAEPEDA